MAYIDLQNRSPKVETLPDFRIRVTRIYDVQNFATKTLAEIQAHVQLSWGTQDEVYSNCFLIKQDVSGQDGDSKDPNKEPPKLVRIFEQLNGNAETPVGLTDVSFDQYGRKTVVNEWIQLSAGTSVYQTVGSSNAGSPFTDCILKTEERTNDGTVMRIKRTYINAGEMSDTEQLKFGGALLLRELTYLNQVPPTPAGWTLVTQSTEYIQGLPLYKYGFANGNASAGAGGVIDTNTEYFYSPDQGTTGITRTTIKQISASSVTSNPITTPSGFQLISVDYADQDGYRLWTAQYVKGAGTIATDIETRNSGKLIIYKVTAVNAAPSAPSPTIGGTVVLISTSVRNGTRIEDGVKIYEYTWAEGNGVIDNDVEGRADGSLVYTVTELDLAIATPAYPGMGTAYLVNLKNEASSGHYINRATYIKPPADDSYKKQQEFDHPGVAIFSGSPPQLGFTPPHQRTLLVDVAVTYGTTQITDTPFSIRAYAQFYESYIPETNPTGGPSTPVNTQRGLGGYLAGASGISGTNSDYNGVLCRVWQAQLGSSTPSTFPTGLTVLKTDNDPYLTDITGVKVYRRMKTTFTF